ncbi:hypothetical protein H6A71_01050 [Bifidobacterium pullorum subsp. saeculare]|uniref:hypothetical protein n=1 Tax=Bifidobacterium pullorum TaxID=78448 RepID=UPI00195C7354|nr:hypothetical protein [Bifidobacterium pullorum]MBM6691682.1 hypothetical protein [Bifidobacterium pullorum subsp. saeculare]
MVWVDVIEPGLGEIWNAGRLMLASKTGWAKARQNGCEYVRESFAGVAHVRDEDVRELPSDRFRLRGLPAPPASAEQRA